MPLRTLICVYLFPVNYWPETTDLCDRCTRGHYYGSGAGADLAAIHICRGHLAEERINNLIRLECPTW